MEPKSSAMRSKGNDDDDDQEDVADLYDLAHYDSDEDVQGNVCVFFILSFLINLATSDNKM